MVITKKKMKNKAKIRIDQTEEEVTKTISRVENKPLWLT